MTARNFISDENKFQLAGPPAWWLRSLWEFDNSLVVVPSRQGFYYRLAQRRKPSLTDKICREALFNESDTKMLARYSLIPVTTILATANWSNPYLFEELRRRAPWRLGGVDKVLQQLEVDDQAVEQQKQATIDNMTTVLSKDAWGLYNKKIGLRSHMWVPKTAPPKPHGKAPTIIIP